MTTHEITIDVAGFRRVLDTMKSTVPSRPAMPILSSVRLDWNREQNMFSLSGSNGDQFLRVDCAEYKSSADADAAASPNIIKCVHMLHEDEKEKWQSVCIPYAELREVFSLLPAARRCVMQLRYSKERANLLTIDYQDGKLSLPFESADEFPQPASVRRTDDAQYRKIKARVDEAVAAGQPEEEVEKLRQQIRNWPICSFSIGADALIPPIRDAVTCAASDELRPQMNSVCIDAFADHLVIVATDGHKLYRQSVDAGAGYLHYQTFGAAASAPLLLPKQAVQTLASAFTGQLTVTADSLSLQFQSEGTLLVLRQTEGRYPNYDRVIPKDSLYKVSIDRDSLRMALRRIQLSADRTTYMCTLCSDGTSFTVQANSDSDSRSGSEKVSIVESDAFLPEGYTIGIKISSLLELLSLLDDDCICLFFSEPNRPILLRNDSPNSCKTLLQMPMIPNKSE